MTTINDKKNRLFQSAALVTTVVFILAGCAGEQIKTIEGSALVPAASGTVKYVTTENNNTKVKIETSCLTRPSRVMSGATTYVLWAKPISANATPQNMGAFNVDEKLQGSLETMIPFKEFDLFVTSELAGGVAEPSGEHLMETRIVGAEK
ncbi:MAG: anti-sigma factor [Oligoflexia bacterium]|nr:anti-sigma factor [Oligoflexia bacterium]MBF0366957.1 anti-sigma factor [Oligoflexia bacterium]